MVQVMLTPRDILIDAEEQTRDTSLDGSLDGHGRERVKDWVVSTELEQEGSGERSNTS